MPVTDLSPSSETPEPEYLTEAIPPCTPVEGVTIEPCAGVSPWVGSTLAHRDFDAQPRDLAWFLGGDRIVWARHFVIRGAYLPDTARCFVDNEYHTPTYLNLGTSDYGSSRIGRIKCYADVRVNEYLIGSGPSKLTLRVARPFYGIPMTETEIKEEFAALEAALTGGAPHWRLEVPEDGIIGIESILFIGPSSDVTEEAMVAIDAWGLRTKDDGTVVAVHPYKAYWDDRIVQGDAVTDPGILAMDLPTFRTRLTAAHQGRLSVEGGIAARPEYPPLMTDANRLRQFMVEAGALDNPGFPLKPIPPACGRSVTVQAANRELFDDCATLLAIKDTLRGSGSLNWVLGTPIANWNGITVSGTPQRVTKLKLASQSLTGGIPAQLIDLDGLNELKLAGNQLTGCLPLAVKNEAPSNNDLTALGLDDCQPAPNKPSVGTIAETSIALSWAAVGGASRYGVEYRPSRTESWNVSTDAVTAQTHTVDGLTCGQEYLFRVSAYGDGTTYAAAWSDWSPVASASTTACASPVFDEDTYDFTVAEDATVGDLVGRVSATDPNLDSLTYSITAGNTGNAFAIDSTGAITVAGSLDFETTPSYELTVEASDGTNASTNQVTITVTDENDAPVFEQENYSVSVAEDAAVGDAVGTVSATDPDEADNLTYSITAGNEDGNFAIDGGTGAITVAVALDYETTSEYTLTVEASDGNGGSDTAAVSVTVTDVAEDAPPAPSGLDVTLADGTFTISWTALDGAAKYEVQHTTDAADAAAVSWTALPETTGVRVTYAPDGGPACSTEYRFRVRAYGDGETYTEMWGVESDAESVATAGCAPAFDQDSYTFEAAEDAAVDDPVGTVSATDPDEEDTVSYTITAGNTGNVLAIGDVTGAITVAAALDYETTSEYTLTVEASDGNGGTDTVTVTVTVTDVAEDPPPAPSGVGASLADGTFTISWTALDGAAKYEVQHTTDAADAAAVTWTALPETTGVNATYAPDGGPACSTEYRFRVRAYGDGETYTEMWGAESAAVSVETATCDPEFGEDSYYFFILDTTAADSAVGTVSATDPDTDDTVTYAITGGNDDGKFAINTTTGQLTAAGTFAIASTPYYTLTVEASDGQGGTDTAEVTVSLTIAACANGTVAPRPEEHPRLVRDCSVLLTAKDTLRGTASLNWSANIPLRQWQGIYQGYLDSRASLDSATRHATAVIVSRLGLNGSIPPVLTGLVDLRRLALDNNALTGGIPAELGDLSGLRYLGLHRNRLTGEIPPELGNLSNLDDLRLHGNQLVGEMPPDLRGLGSLRILILNNNRLTGSIPSWLSEMSELRELWLRDNQLTGTIPSALESLDLDDLHLSGNSFVGCIPAGLRDVADNDMDRLGLPDCSP